MWALQVLLAAHTIIGAVWNFSHGAEQTIPGAAWLAMSGLELLCALALILPAVNKSWGILVQIAAVCIAAEILLFSGLHLYSGETSFGPVIYWLVVAAICASIAYGRFVLKPSERTTNEHEQ